MNIRCKKPYDTVYFVSVIAKKEDLILHDHHGRILVKKMKTRESMKIQKIMKTESRPPKRNEKMDDNIATSAFYIV